jgi:hypothetical protein
MRCLIVCIGSPERSTMSLTVKYIPPSTVIPIVSVFRKKTCFFYEKNRKGT